MNDRNAPELNESERYILNAIRDIRFGSIEVTIHDANVVQVEKSEKRRFDNVLPPYNWSTE